MKLEWTPPKIEPKEAHLISEPDYSADVVFGKSRKDGSEMPARNFFDAAIAETDLVGEFVQNYDGDIDQAFRATARSLHQATRDIILSDRWKWDRLTLRRSGEMAGTQRDIFDTGNLYRGQKLEFIR
jgi:hypothetical protein